MKINRAKGLENLVNISKIKVATVLVIGMFQTKTVKAYKVIWVIMIKLNNLQFC